jgi:TatD DNase family protein
MSTADVFIDSHAHLDGERFATDRGEVIARAREAGIVNILAVGSGEGPGTLDCAVKLADKYDFIYATVGIHPHEAKLATEADFQELESLARRPKVIAWGEIGLDYFYDHSPREIQKEVFLKQMELARTVELPIVIHCRPSRDSDDAWKDCLALIERHWAPNPKGGIFHCFTGDYSHTVRGIEMGFMISFAGNLTFPKAASIRNVVEDIPLEHVLIETDCPFLAPVPHRGKRNEPAFVKEVARTIAAIRNFTMEEIGLKTSQNFYRFFSLPENAGSI